MNEKPNLALTDLLAIERTKLANERTFLSYFRTAFVFLATGATFLKIEYFSNLYWLGWVFVALFPITMLFGLIRYLKIKKEIMQHYLLEIED